MLEHGSRHGSRHGWAWLNTGSIPSMLCFFSSEKNPLKARCRRSCYQQLKNHGKAFSPSWSTLQPKGLLQQSSPLWTFYSVTMHVMEVSSWMRVTTQLAFQHVPGANYGNRRVGFLQQCQVQEFRRTSSATVWLAQFEQTFWIFLIYIFTCHSLIQIGSMTYIQ